MEKRLDDSSKKRAVQASSQQILEQILLEPFPYDGLRYIFSPLFTKLSVFMMLCRIVLVFGRRQKTRWCQAVG